jgi:replicative DNA helicase
MAELVIQNEELEMAALGSALMAGSTQGVQLSGEDFYRIRNQWIWSALRELESSGQSVDVVTVADKLNFRLKEIGGGAYLAQLIDSTPTSRNLGTYAAKLREYTSRRKLVAYCEELVKRVMETGDPLDKIIEYAHQTVIEISGQAIPKETIEDALDVACRFVEVLHSERRCIPTGILKLDRALGGLERQTQVIIAGRPGLGKTALAFQIARNLAAASMKTIFFSLEMSSVGLWTRAACGSAGVMWRDILGKRAIPQQVEKAEKMGMEIGKNLGEFLWIDENKRDIDSIIRICSKYRPDAVITDHIRLVRGYHQEKEHKRLGIISWELHDLAKMLDCATVTVCQLSRSLEYREDKVPELQDLRDSGELEENADNVLMLHWRRKENAGNIVPVELWVRKFRNGPSNLQLNFEFDILHQWFDYEEEIPDHTV